MIRVNGKSLPGFGVGVSVGVCLLVTSPWHNIDDAMVWFIGLLVWVTVDIITGFIAYKA